MDRSQEEFSFPPTTQESGEACNASAANDSAAAASAASPPKRKSCFKRRNSVTAADEDRPQLPQPPPSNGSGQHQERKPPEPRSQERNPIVPLNLVPTRICGPSRSKCGYCGGTRLHVLGVDDGSNVVLSIHKSSDKPEGGKKVDEESTAKSYGLLFDYLPFDTYQELIDRGWRRSGKHLYRPHNFESCCPAISIRLDTTKFASLYSSKSNKPKSSIENSVLVGGSKSQKRVGRNLLRALEAYNTKIKANKQHNSLTEANCNSPGCEYASHVAKMKLAGDSVSGSEDGGEVATDSKHVDKKSRQASPARRDDIMEGVTPQNESNGVASTKMVLDKQTLSKIEESEHQLLQQLSLITYQTITKQVINALERAENVLPPKQPKWAWWGDDDKSVVFTDIPKWCLFKFYPANQSNCKGGDENHPSTIVMASTVACAAASGRSQGIIGKAHLGTAIVDALKVHLYDLRGDQSQLCMQNVVFHEKSGQVQITFRLTPRFSTEIALSKQENKPVSALAAQESIQEPFSEFFSRCKNDMMYQSAKNTHHVPHKGSSSQQQLFLVVRSVPVSESSIQPEVHQLFCKYQSSIHGDDNPYLSESSNHIGEGSDEYKLYMQQGSVGFLDIDATYGYLVSLCICLAMSIVTFLITDLPGQSAAQRSKIKKSYLSFYRFLCETPLKHEAINKSSDRDGKDAAATLEDGYDINICRGGTYHQQYRLCTSEDSFDGPLIAVGVVGTFVLVVFTFAFVDLHYSMFVVCADILPDCLSSVYAFYDPILSAQLELGKYTALREIEWVRRAKWLNDRYYYLGYYIHSCQKMIYKAEYKPSELLCPVNFIWVDFEVARRRLEKKSPLRHNCALYESGSADSSVKQQSILIENIVLDIGDNGITAESLLNVSMLSRDGRKMIDPIITEFANEVGPELSRKLVVKLS